ncbi:MAG TPA: glycosyltransferase family 39 protein [Myxococcales bacterium]|nr:glycosyltransferase family 39 protein [Myxococcales bacterium]
MPLSQSFQRVQARLGFLGAWFPLLLLAFALALFLPDLGHPSIQRADEACHQPATRGVYDTGVPRIYEHPIVPNLPGEEPLTVYWDAGVFLHKPPLSFWLGGLFMLLFGVTPMALRFVSLLTAYAASVGIYYLGRRVIGAWLAAGLAVAFLCLPFGFAMVQGYQWSDVTDVSLLGFLTLSMWALLVALERDDAWIAAGAGALCGCAYLCKSALALTPLGVVVALAVLGSRGLAPRVRLRLVLAFAGAAVLVAAPWNLYSALRWPDVYKFEARYTMAFLSDTSRLWARPQLDGVFNDVNAAELGPWPVSLFLLAGLWLVWAAWKRRTLVLWLLALWLWGEWVPLSIAVVKVPAHAWGAVPAALLAVGLLLADSFERPWLACVALGAFATHVALRLAPWLSQVRRVLPAGLQAAKRPGLAEGLVLAGLAGALGYAATKRLWGDRRVGRLLGAAAVVCAAWVGFVQSAQAIHASWKDYGDAAVDSYGDDIGKPLDALLPKNSVLFLTSRDPKCCFGRQSLMFYSGRMTYPAREDLVDIAREKGFHPYLVSGIAQPYARVAGVPASSWLQAYDLDAPLVAPADLPPDLTRIDVPVEGYGDMHVLGVAVHRGDSERDRYVFYVRTDRLRTIDVTFDLDDGTFEAATLRAIRQLDWNPRRPQRWPPPYTFDFVSGTEVAAPAELDPEWITNPSSSSWFTVSVPGPLRGKLRGIKLLGADLPLP